MDLEKSAACDVVSGLIIKYIDGELDEATAQLVQRHIEICSDCRKLYCDLRAVCRAAADSAYLVPAELHTRVMSAVKADKAARRRTRLMKRFSTYAGIGIAAMLCIFIGVTAIISNLGNNDDLFGAFSSKLAGGEAEKIAGYQYSFNRITDPAKDDLLLEARSHSESDWLYDGITSADTKAETAPEDQPKLLTPPEAMATTAAAYYRLPDIALFVGEWELIIAGGKPVTLAIQKDYTFSLVDTAGNTINGNYTIVDDLISFSYPGGIAEYRFCLESGELGLSHFSGDNIIK